MYDFQALDEALRQAAELAERSRTQLEQMIDDKRQLERALTKVFQKSARIKLSSAIFKFLANFNKDSAKIWHILFQLPIRGTTKNCLSL